MSCDFHIGVFEHMSLSYPPESDQCDNRANPGFTHVLSVHMLFMSQSHAIYIAAVMADGKVPGCSYPVVQPREQDLWETEQKQNCIILCLF